MILYNASPDTLPSLDWFGGCGTNLWPQDRAATWQDAGIPETFQECLDAHTGVLIYEGTGPELAPDQQNYHTRHTFEDAAGNTVTLYLRNTGKFPCDDNEDHYYIGDNKDNEYYDEDGDEE